MGLTDEIEALQAGLRSQADSDRAVSMAAYMKDRFEFLGVPTPERRAIVKSTITTSVVPARSDLIEAVNQLWSWREREFQYCGSDLLRRWQRVLEAEDLRWLGQLITARPWWDTVDALATHPVGHVVAHHRTASRPTIDQWVSSDDLWLNRAAILHQLLYKNDTDAEQLFHYCDLHAASTEFFHRKAIGWALRQYARTDPDAVRSYVEQRGEVLSGLTVREATKHLD